jgi:branched-subunit amino acid permease
MVGASLPSQPLPSLEAFLIGVLGALLGYLILYRQTRIAEFVKTPGENWKSLLFDLVIYLICGGLVTTFLVLPSSPKEAFTGGLAWQAIAGGAVAGTELATYKKGRGR